MSRPGLALLILLATLGAALYFLWPQGEAAHVGPALARTGPAPTARAGAELAGGEGALGADRAALPVSAETVRVAGAGQLSGIVRARATGAGVADVAIRLYAYPPQGAEFIRRVMKLSNDPNLGQRFKPVATARSGADGRFLVASVLPGKYFVEAVGDLHVPDPIERVVVAPAGSEVELFVRSGARVIGQVWLANGEPAVGARVHVGHGESQFIPAVRSGDITERRVETDARGRFEVGGLPPSAGMQVTAVAPAHGIAFAQGLELTPGATTEVELTFAAPAALRGRAFSVAEPTDAASTPLAGAELAAVPRGLREMQFVDSLMEASHGTSGADGGFRLSPLAPGTVDVLAWAPGHRPARFGPFPSQAGLDLNIGDIKLERGPLIIGRVVDTAGNPLSAVNVRWEPFLVQGQLDLSFAAYLTQAIPGFAFPITDDAGRFEAGPFPSDRRQRLYFSKPGYRMTSRSATVGDGNELVVEMVQGGAVRGQVVDRASGAPITRFQIQGTDRIDQDTESPSAVNPFGAGQVVEHPEGRFEVPAVRTGNAELRFEAKGYLPRTVAGLSVAEGEVLEGVVVELDRGAVVSGVVRDASGAPVAGARVVAHREASGNLFIELRRSFESGQARLGGGRNPDFTAPEFMNNLPQGVLAFGVGLGVVESSVSGPDGSYTLEAVDRGDWVVLGYHRDFAAGTSDEVSLEWTAGEPAPVRSGVDVVMTQGATLLGTVRDRRGDPQGGVMIVAFSPAAFTSAPNSGGAYQGESRADGSYAIPNMVGGGYFLMVTRGDEHLDPFSFLSTMQLELVVVPNSGEVRRDLVDQSAATTRVFGNVLRAGEPVSGGSLLALSSQGASLLGVDVKAAAVAHDGSYSFPGLPPGSYRMRYLAGGRPLMMTIEVPDQPQARIDLALPGGSIAGRVVDAFSGAGVERAFVEVTALDDDFTMGGLLGSALQTGLRPSGDRTDREGAFEVPGLAAGRYRVEVSLSTGDYQPGAGLEVLVEDGRATADVVLELEPGLVVRGLVRGPTGAPLEGALVRAWLPGERGVLSARDFKLARSDAEGAFALSGVGPGALRLAVSHADYAPVEAFEVEVAAGMLPVEVVMQTGTPVVVRAFDRTGAPAYGATARLLIEGGVELAGDTSLMEWFNGLGIVGLDGTADLGLFAAGSYRLEVTRGDEVSVRTGVQIGGAGELELETRFE